jgi:hypothetical protein
VVVDVTDLELESRLLGGLPIVNVFYERLGIDRRLEAHGPSDARLRLSPSVALGVVIRNLVIRHAPRLRTRRVGGPLRPDSGRAHGRRRQAAHDDRIGRMLARLFDADRASLLTRLVLDAVEAFDIDLSRLHNDSTSVKLSGAYEQPDGRERGGKPTPAAAQTHRGRCQASLTDQPPHELRDHAINRRCIINTRRRRNSLAGTQEPHHRPCPTQRGRQGLEHRRTQLPGGDISPPHPSA